MKNGVFQSVKALVFLVLLIAILPSCKDDEVVIANPIADLKGGDWEDNIGEIVTLEAYLALHPTPALFFDMEDRNKNEAIPEERYLRLEIPETIFLQLGEANHGAKVSIRGEIIRDMTATAETLAQLLGDSYPCMMEVLDLPVTLDVSDLPYPVSVHPCVERPILCDLMVVQDPETYVLIYSGGADPGNAYLRYWNDINLFAQAMLNMGVKHENIKIIYKDGSGETHDEYFVDADWAATPSGLNSAFDWFGDVLDVNDRFILYVSNHGAHNFSDTDQDELDGDDEAIHYYNESTLLMDDFLAEKISGLMFDEFIGVFQCSFGGGFLRDLRGPNRVLISASSEDEVSYGGPISQYSLLGTDYYYDAFTFHLMTALFGFDISALAYVDADMNDDGKISVGEAFEYARVADQADETPQIESDGDGIPSSTVAGESGTLAESMFFTD